MPELTFSPNIVFSLSDIITAVIAGAIIYSFNLGFKRFLDFLPKLFMGMRRRELKKIKKLRTNRYEVQRQIAKESAYFAVFMACSAVAIGFWLLASGAQSHTGKMLTWVIVMMPLLTFEFLWLRQQAFVLELTKLAARLSNGFTHHKRTESVPVFRKKLQRQRREAAVNRENP